MKEVEWLLKNNLAWSTLNSSTVFSTYKNNALDEIKSFFNKDRTDYKRTCIPIFSGRTCHLEDAAFITQDIIENSRKELLTWLEKNVVIETPNGIDIARFGRDPESNISYCIDCLRKDDDNPYDSMERRIHMPEFRSSWSMKGNEKERVCIEPISSMRIPDVIIFRPSNPLFITEDLGGMLYNLAYYIEDENDKSRDNFNKFVIGVCDEANKARCKKKKKNNILDENDYVIKQDDTTDYLLNNNRELMYKLHRTNDLVIDMRYSYLYRGTPIKTLASFKNFPEIVDGYFIIKGVYKFESLNHFPKNIGSLVFSECIYDNDLEFPNGVEVFGNVVISGANLHFMLKALIKSDIKIHGIIYSPLYVGKIDKLREIAITNKWI